MKPVSFEYHSPDTVEEALDVLSEFEDAEIMAGNQSLAFEMSTRDRRPDHVVDISRLSELDTIEDYDDRIEIGALTSHRTIEESAILRETLPLLPESAQTIAGPAVKNMGTIGGNIGTADPAYHYPAVLCALEATVTLAAADGERSVPVREFFRGAKQTVTDADELITHISIPTEPYPPERTGMAFCELKRVLKAGAIVSAGAIVRVSDPTANDPTIETVHIALANAADTPIRAEESERILTETPLTEQTLETAARTARTNVSPPADVHAGGEYKASQIEVYTRRAVEAAYERAVEG